jgi:4-hydroxy-2-oxoheptanedioate aldolase
MQIYAIHAAPSVADQLVNQNQLCDDLGLCFRNLHTGERSMSGKIKQLLDEGKKVKVMSAGGLITPKMVDVIGSYGILDGIWFDQEHSAIPHQQMELLTIACRATGLDSFARVPPTDYCTIMRPLETGCSGVMIAQVRTLEQVETAVSWAKYPPVGVRGTYMSNAETRYGATPLAEHVKRANQERWVAIQIETLEAVEIVDQIAAVDGVDWLFVGPSDLSVTLGVPGEALHPKCVAALGRVADAAKASHIPWGALSGDLEHAQKCSELGCQLHSVYSEANALKIGLFAQQEAYKSL